ncbi:MAG: VPLPA-CTERM sorting domain-containing protein [Chromatiales bacterium]|nr:VPLPA-CTERM sorting domain-containing protein [Chromatiales bacterium]
MGTLTFRTAITAGGVIIALASPVAGAQEGRSIGITEVDSAVLGGPRSINLPVEEKDSRTFTNIESADPASYYPDQRINVTNLDDPRRWNGGCSVVEDLLGNITNRCNPTLTGKIQTSGIIGGETTVPGGTLGLPALSFSEVELSAQLPGDLVQAFSTGFAATTTTQSHFFIRRDPVSAGVIFPESIDIPVTITINYDFSVFGDLSWKSSNPFCSTCFANARVSGSLQVGSFLPGGVPNSTSAGGINLSVEGFLPGWDVPAFWQGSASLPGVADPAYETFLNQAFNGNQGKDNLIGSAELQFLFTVPLGDRNETEWFRSSVRQTTYARAGIGGELNDILLAFTTGITGAEASARAFLDPLFNVHFDALGDLAPFFEVFYPEEMYPPIEDPELYFAGLSPSMRESYRAALEEYYGVDLGPATPVPLPASGWLLLTAMGGMAWRAARRSGSGRARPDTG